MIKKDKIFVRLGDIAKELGISKRSLERFISNRNGIVPGRYQMPDTKAYIYDANEFIAYFKLCLKRPEKKSFTINKQKQTDHFKYQVKIN